MFVSMIKDEVTYVEYTTVERVELKEIFRLQRR